MRLIPIARGFVIAVLGLAAVLAGAPAQADGHQLALSTDGVHWHDTIPALFPASVRWVPGDSASKAFYVRNDSSDGATLAVDLVGETEQNLMASGDLTISARVDGGPARAVSRTGTHALVRDVRVAPGNTHRITVRVALAADSRNPTQAERFDFHFAVRLTQAAGNGNGNGHHHGQDNGLPNTGADISPLAILLALGLCVGGTALVAGSRRRPANTLERQS